MDRSGNENFRLKAELQQNRLPVVHIIGALKRA
jgi:hypothetical protein